MSISPLFKTQVEQDIGRCESQTAINGSERLYAELVNRYRTLTDNFMQNLPAFRKVPTSPYDPDYRPELRLIASKLRTYLMTKKREGTEMTDDPLKVKVDEFIQRGTDIGRMEFHPAGGGILFSSVSGPLYDAWMGEISIFNERHLKEHPLHDSISTTYSHYRKNPSYHEQTILLRICLDRWCVQAEVQAADPDEGTVVNSGKF